MAVSTTFPGAKLESLLHNCSSSSRASPSTVTQLSFPGGKPRRNLIHKGVVRCDAQASDVVVKTDGSSNATALSALEQLKASAADRYTKERSSIVVIGLSVHTAPVEMREKLAIPEAEWPRAIGELCSLNHIEEAAVLSTCNRMEIYVVALSQHRGVKEVMEWMSKTSSVPVSELCKHRFLLYNKDATQHIFEVSAGLDSLVLGEGQILAQVKQVVKVGQGVTGFGRNISGLFKHAITVGKRVRAETNIAAGAVSVSSAAVELAFMKLPGTSHDARMLVIGAGKMGKLVIKHLVAKGCTKMVVVNRTEERVAAIREELKDVEIIYKPLSEMLTCVGEADVVFTSTASETPVDTSTQTTHSTLSEEVIEEVIACARYGELEELKTIINSFPVTHLELKDNLGNTALHMASANGHLEIVEFIIQTLGSYLEKIINIQNDSGNTPLHWSALNGHEKVVELLVKNGADAKIKNRAGRTPMFEAQQNNHEKVIEFLLANVDPDKEEESTTTENDADTY